MSKHTMPAPKRGQNSHYEWSRSGQEGHGMMICVRIGDYEMEIATDSDGHSPEYIEDVAHRIGRQVAEMYHGAPEPTYTIDEDPGNE